MANPHWRWVRAMTMAVTFGRDCIFPVLPAQQCDHLTYRRLGHELPFFDLVPLHAGTHAIVTALRDAGLAAIVNPLLRLAYALWLLPWVVAIIVLLQLMNVLPAGTLMHDVHAVENGWSSLGDLLARIFPGGLR